MTLVPGGPELGEMLSYEAIQPVLAAEAGVTCTATAAATAPAMASAPKAKA